MKMIFEPITESSIEIAVEIINSNSTYNTLENGNPVRSIDEVKRELLNPDTESFLIIHENKPIGVIDFLKNNPKDNCPWLGLLMIKSDYHSLGYGKKAYRAFEDLLIKQTFNTLRLGVLQENLKAQEFWKSLGFKRYRQSTWQEKIIDCFEKNI